MSSAGPASDGDIVSSTTRRKSGRVSRMPEKYAPGLSPGGRSKRKRGDDDDGDDSGVDASELLSEEEEQDESSEGEPDEQELRERKRKQKGRARAKKPATKKAKTNGKTVSLAMRPASSTAKKNTTKRPRKAAVRKSTLAEDEPEGLYADVFASGDRLEDVAARWVARFNEHEGLAVAEIINLVLRAAGCTVQIDQDDIADPDNSHNRIAEIQEEFQAQEVTDYPLIAKAKDGGGQTFRKALHGFFYTLIQTVAQSGLMYENTILIETFEVWIGSMSSTGNRPFRHTSTVASLAIITSLAQVAADIVENTAKKMRQSESEKKKSRINKTRVSAVNQEVEQYNQKLELVDTYLNEWFEMVYIHRYRDVDPKIRVDCVVALVEWILIYPDKFFDGSHLRYLGWVLSDPNPPTRVEVLHQLTRLFRDKDKLAGLKTFTERFRPRIVEIATRDAENNVRAAAVDLLDVLREAGFLEPDDIDSVGKLIFDADAKVRKSVVGFFAENVNAAYEANVEDMGGEEALNEALAPSDEDDEEYKNPRLEWLKLKCLVEQLLSYDEQDTELPSQMERISPSGAELGLVAAGIESRFSLAAQALYDAIPEMRSWEVLAGYLLYDHSRTVQNGTNDDAEMMLRQNCRLEEKHETVLLDILNAVVRIRLQRLAEAHKDRKKAKVQRESNDEDQADMAKKLAMLIPQLLKKFGALPEAAALCLRLERELDLDVFQELRQNAALTALLDDINKQFLTHHNERVLSEAIGSILHAQGNDELKEMIGLKIQALWDDLINTFDALRRGKDFKQRGNLKQKVLVGVSNVVLKMAQLAKASDASVLDHVYAPAKSKSKAKQVAMDTPPITALLEILDRGVPVDGLGPELQESEDILVRHTMSLMLVYFMWKCRSCSIHIEEGTSIPDDELTAIAERKDGCITALMRIMQSRKGADDVRLDAANLLLDIYNMFRSLKAKKSQAIETPKKTQGRASLDAAAANDDWEALCQDIDDATAKVILQILSAAETHLAKLTNKRLEEPDVDDDPVDPDDEPQSDDEDEDTDQTEKQVRTLLAEERLCHFGARIVQAVQVGSLDSNGGDGVRVRLERNKARLTPTWREVVGHLDAAKQARRKAGAGAGAGKQREEQKKKTSEAVVVEEEEEEEEDDEGEEEDEEEGERRDEIEDEEMVDAEGDGEMEVQEGINGVEKEAEEEEGRGDEDKDKDAADADAEQDSILGD